MIPYIICVILSYFLGCINPAYVLAKRKGKNILAIGSHNPGASNTMLNFGWAAGILVGACDILKACIAVFLCKTFFPALPYIGYIAGISCIMGHMYNVFLHFKGGKGLASLMGMMLILDWRCFLLLGALIIVITVLTRYIAIATCSVAVLYPAYLLWARSDVWLLLMMLAIALPICYKHIENFKRIASGEEAALKIK
jgi:glycerol-3-phosphate acyltransferase PlsY